MANLCFVCSGLIERPVPVEVVKSVIEDSESSSAPIIENSTDAYAEPGTSQQTENEPTESMEEAVANIPIVPAAVVAPVTSLTLLFKVCIYSD